MTTPATQHYAEEHDPNAVVRTATSRKHTIVACQKKINGEISIFLHKFGTTTPAAFLKCTISGYNNTFQVESDRNGYIYIEQIPAGHYALIIDNDNYNIHTIGHREPPCQIWIKMADSQVEIPPYNMEDYTIAEEDSPDGLE